MTLLRYMSSQPKWIVADQCAPSVPLAFNKAHFGMELLSNQGDSLQYSWF